MTKQLSVNKAQMRRLISQVGGVQGKWFQGGTYAPLQLTIEHYHCRHAHKHQHKGVYDGLPPAQSRRDNGRYQHEPTEGFPILSRQGLETIYHTGFLLKHIISIIKQTYRSFFTNFGQQRLGQKSENPAINTHNMASSSSSCPNRLSVAWKYIELRPTTISRTHSKCIPGVTNFPYSLNSIISTGGSRINRKLLNCCDKKIKQ